MRLAVVNLTSGGLSGGYLKYLRTLVPLIEKDPRISSLAVFVPHASADSARGFASARTFSPEESRGSGKGLRELVMRERPDVVFIPTSRWIEFGVPSAVMVRNMEPLAVPFGGNGLVDSLKNIGRRLATRRACKSATAVIAVSRYVDSWLADHWHIEPSKMKVVYHGVSDPSASAHRMPAAMQAHADQPFIFTAGSIRPARGLEDLIDAFRLVAAASPTLRLVIAGSVDKGAERYHKKLLSRAEQGGVADRVTWLGRASNEEMQWCFSRSALFVTTSRAEACPNTVLEAMASGGLTVSGDNPPMPEFLRETAYYYKLGDAESLRAAVLQGLAASPAEAAARREAARVRASEFTWSRTAEETISFLLTLAGSQASR